MNFDPARTDRTAALRIVAIYAFIASLWIYLSDNVVALFTRDPATLLQLSVFKGLLFIVVTSTILYQLIVRHFRRSRLLEDDIKAKQNLIDSLMEGTTDAIFVKDRQGRYLLFNTAAANVTGKNAAEVLGNDDTFLFSSEEAAAIMVGDRRVMDEGRVLTFKEYLTVADGTFRTFLATKGPISDATGEVRGLFGISRDITDRDQAEQALQSTIELLRICNESGTSRELMRNLTLYFQQVTGCEAIGVRLREGEDFPYYETRGFPAEFVIAENSLCALDQAGEMVRDSVGHPLFDCMCGNILCGRFDPSLPFFTVRGSFWSGCTTELLASTTDADRLAKTRNRCNGEGYESVALIPLRQGGATFGLFQFNDRRRERFTADKIARLEDLVAYVAMALAKHVAEDALTESSRFSQQIIDNAEVGVIVYGRDLRYQVWNPYMEKLTGLEADDILGRDPLEISPFKRETGLYGMLQGSLEGRTYPSVDVPYHSSCNGRSGWSSVSHAPLKNSRDEIIGVIATVRDITARRRAQEELEEATYRLQLATASGHLGIWDRNILHDVLVWDDRMFEIYGVVRDSFSCCFDAWRRLLHPDDAEAVLEANMAAVAGEREYDVEFRIVRPDGKVKYVRANGVVIRDGQGRAVRMIGLNQDITDRKEIEEQLRQAQKMEAIGQLAGGVAHDFNNILTVIYGYCHMMQAGMEAGSPHRAKLDQILAASERAANLTRSLLAFSRKQAMNPQPVNLNDIILNVGKLLSRIIGEDIRMETVLSEHPAMVFADSGQLEQVLMNLAANARDAMTNGGLLTIETELVEAGEGFVHAHGSGPPGSYVVMSLSDSGAGMAVETRKKIFEPFFTTKEVGKGTGLGLAIVYGVIKQHNGYIDVSSEPGRGTTFRIYLPLFQGGQTDAGVDATGESPPMGTETILIAEDDAAIRQLTCSFLRKFGYNVIFAENGEEAVEKFRTNSEVIDMVVMDMIMPGKSGMDAFAEIRALRPDIKALLMSGYSPEFLRTRGGAGFAGEMLKKPFQPLDFIRKVRFVLDS